MLGRRVARLGEAQCKLLAEAQASACTKGIHIQCRTCLQQHPAIMTAGGAELRTPGCGENDRPRTGPGTLSKERWRERPCWSAQALCRRVATSTMCTFLHHPSGCECRVLIGELRTLNGRRRGSDDSCPHMRCSIAIVIVRAWRAAHEGGGRSRPARCRFRQAARTGRGPQASNTSAGHEMHSSAKAAKVDLLQEANSSSGVTAMWAFHAGQQRSAGRAKAVLPNPISAAHLCNVAPRGWGLPIRRRLRSPGSCVCGGDGHLAAISAPCQGRGGAAAQKRPPRRVGRLASQPAPSGAEADCLG